jgi:hypothetical protein
MASGEEIPVRNPEDDDEGVLKAAPLFLLFSAGSVVH